MGVRIEKKTIVYESVGGESIVPWIVFPSKVEIKEYMKKNPYPETDIYTLEDLLADTSSSGAWWLPDGLTEEQKDYIIDMTEYFL